MGGHKGDAFCMGGVSVFIGSGKSQKSSYVNAYFLQHLL